MISRGVQRKLRFRPWVRQYVKGLALLGLLSLTSSQIQASPWLEANETALRHHYLYLLASTNRQAPDYAWPLSFATIKDTLNSLSAQSLNASQLASYHFLQQALDHATAKVALQSRSQVASAESPFVGWEQPLNGRRAFRSQLGLLGDKGALQLRLTAIKTETEADDLHFDGSYAAWQLGNWALGLGSRDMAWGQGWQQNVVIATEARSAPGIFLQRLLATPSPFSWLKPLGPWDFSAFSVRLQDAQGTPAHPWLTGMQLSAQPLPGLSLGWSNLTLSGGEDIGHAAADAWQPWHTDERGQALLKSSWHLRFHQVLTPSAIALSLYTNWAGLVERPWQSRADDRLYGVAIAHSLGPVHSRLSIEWRRTTGEDAGDTLYPDGFSHFGKPLASSLAPYQRWQGFSGFHQLPSGPWVQWLVGQYSAPATTESGLATAETTSRPQKGHLSNLQLGWPLTDQLQLRAGWQQNPTSNHTAEPWRRWGFLGLEHRW